MKKLKDLIFEPSKNETAVIYGPIPPKIPRIKDSIFVKIVKFILGEKERDENGGKRKK